MSLLELFYWLEYTPILVEMRASPWIFPAIASLHLLGLIAIGGSVLLVDLRLLGLGLKEQPPIRLATAVRPLFLGGLAIMLPTGILLFLCFATKYYYLEAFWVKLTSLMLALALTFTVRRRVVEGSAEAGMTKIIAAVSLTLWLTIALGGRLIGFP